MTEYEKILQNVEEGMYAAEVTPQHENHRAWVAVYTIPESYFGTVYYNNKYRSATHVVRYVEVHDSWLERYNRGQQGMTYKSATIYHRWQVDSLKDACDILSKYLEDDEPILKTWQAEYPNFG